MKPRPISGPAAKTPAAAWIVLLAVILFFGFVRIRLAGVPLERDEGEYAYIGRLILDGFAPYGAAYSMKLPGIFAAYAAIMGLFGRTVEGIHLGLLLVVSLSTGLVFVLARRMFGAWAAAAAAAAFAFLSAEDAMLGLTANAEHFILPPVLAGVLLLHKAIAERRGPLLYGLSGVFFGCGFLVKQHGALFGIFGALYLLGALWSQGPAPRRFPASRFFGFAAGAILPIAGIALLFVKLGVFDKFWFYTAVYSRTYVSHAAIDDALVAFFSTAIGIVRSAPLLWLSAAVGVAVLWRRRPSRKFLAGFAAASFLAVVPGFYFRPHYFILLVPAAALLCAAAASALGGVPWLSGRSRPVRTAAVASLAVFVFGGTLLAQGGFWLRDNPRAAAWRMYGPLPFVFNDSKSIVDHIRPALSVGDRLVVIGSEPQIYFYFGAPAPTGFIYVYYLTEEQPFAAAMQAEFIRDVEAARPRYLVYAKSWGSENISEERYQALVEWYERFRDAHYELVGLVNVISERKTEVRWGEEARAYRLQAGQKLLLYQRKAAGIP